jgi:acetyl esterase
MSELPAAPASGRAPVDPSTISLSAHSRGLLAASAAAPPFAATPLPAQRSAREDTVAAALERRGVTPVASARDVAPEEAGVALRVYEPLVAASAAPAILFLHGGGWALCSVRTHDEVCRMLCSFSGCEVVSCDYRLSPEARFPLPLDDCAAGYTWAARRAKAGVVLCGDSAGGNLAAALALRLRDERAVPQPLAQVLIYPALDAECSSDSYVRFSSGFSLTLDKMAWFWGHYLGTDAALRKWPYVSPLHAQSLEGLPPALLVLADADVLRDEGEAYAAALRGAKGRADVRVFGGVLHGFVADPDSDAAPEALRFVAAWLRDAGLVQV